MFTQYNIDSVYAYLRTLYGDKKLLVTPQIYSDNLGTVDVGATVNGNMQVTNNADFVLLGYGVNSDQSSMLGTILFTDSGSGEQFMNRAANIRSCCTVNLVDKQVNLHYPRFIGGNSSVSFVFTNSGADPTGDTVVSIIGFSVREYA